MLQLANTFSFKALLLFKRTQYFPFNKGLGSVQVLDLNSVPPPQVTVHVVLVHCDHPPSPNEEFGHIIMHSS